MKMVGKKSHNLMKNLIAGFIAVALLVSGVCFFGTDSSLVMASDSDVKTEDGGYAVKPYSAADFAEFRGDTYTYPKLTAADGSNYQEWLFAGWFTNSTCTTPVGSNVKTVEGEVYAKFVDADLSYIKCQVTPGTDVDSEQAHMRVISTVDSKYYSETGFYITYKDRGAKKYPTDNVYRRLSATEDGMECGYSPIAFNEDAEYLFALRLTGIGNANFDEAFYIQSYWETLDGTEVLGMSRYARVEDSYEKIVNVPVRLYASDVEATGGSVSVTYDANQFSLYKTDEYPNGYDNGKGFTVTNVDSTTASGKITVAGTADNDVAEGLFVNLRLQLKDGATIESNTTFTVADETFVNGETSVTGLDVPNVIFKNYPVAYTAGTVDTSWYKGFEDNNTFVISSAADLYGLASIVNATDGEYKNEQFSGDTIILGSDITINTATLDPEADGWDATGASYIPWTPIGNDKNFQGTFDGKGHEIKGVYVTGDTTLLGLFGYVNGENAMVTDLSLTNSYVEHTGGTVFVGGVVGYLNKGTIDKVYSNAIVKSNGAEFGGIVGRAEGLVEECWFDGEVYANRIDAAYVKAAGIVGTSWSQTGTGKTFTPLTIRNCLNTGSVTYNVTTTSGAGAGLGGIYGGDRGYTDLTVEYCINTGVIETNQKNGTGSIVGNISQNTTIDSVKTYSTADITNCYGATNTISTRTDGRILGYNNANCTVTQTDNVTQDAENMNGHVAYDTIKGGLSVLTGQVKDGAWAIREQSSNLKDGVPVPVAFADEWIDVAWYYGAEKSDDKGETYSISTAEELYGFSAISRGYTFGEETIQGYNFDGDTIQLANDITVNNGKATSWEKGTIPSREWTPIGNSTTSFQGTFDGQKHYIKGIYVNATTQNAGLFGYAEDATIQDLQLINSYIHSTVDRVGGIAGYYTGNMYRVYCDAIVVSTRNDNKESDCGGLIGYCHGTADVTNEISQCWFAGTAKGYNRTGGIVGRLNNGRKEISNTLVTGTVITTIVDRANSQIGGLVGSVNNYVNAVLDITSSLGAGTMQVSYTGNDAQIGGVVGYKGENGTVTINNVYTTFSTGLGGQNNTSETSAVEDDYIKIESIDDINSPDVYTNDVMNLGYYLYDSTWVARTTDIPVPRCFVGTVVDENDIVEDTSAHTAWYDADPDAKEFELKTENDLLGFAEIVNASEGDYASEQFSGQKIKLTKDMDLNRGWSAPETADDEVKPPTTLTWTPIGNDKSFQGTFDGQGHEIKGIYVTGDSTLLGLFGYVNGVNAMIKNLRLTNSYVEHIGATVFVGGVVGYLNKGTINQVYCKAIVKSNGAEFGGIVGRAEGLVEECWFDGEVYANRTDATYVKAAGIVGTSWSNTGSSDTDNPLTIRNCLNTGKVIYNVTTTSGAGAGIGGIYGGDRAYTDLTVEDCVNTGIVESNQKNGTGSIVGNISKNTKITNSTLEGVTTYSKAEITNCYGATNTITTRADGRILGYNNANCTVTQTDNVTRDYEAMKGDVVYNTADDGGLDLNYAIWIARATDVPIPIYFVGTIVAEKDTVEDNSGRVYVDTGWYIQDKKASTYSIETAHELAGLAQLVNDGITFENKTINLIKDIDLNKGWIAPETADDEVETPVNTWTPIGNNKKFKGIFNGQGHEVKGVYVTGTTTLLGLFGGVEGAGSMVMNLSLRNSYVEHTGATAFVGGVAGYLNKGTIKQVYCNAIVKSNGVEFGGIVGRAEGLVEGCWFDGEVYANRTDATYVKAAGIVGTSWSQTGTGKTFTPLTIRNCLNTGSVIYTVDATSGSGAGLGGIYGGDRGYTDVTVEYCLNTGVIETNQKNGTGSIVGNISQNTTIDSAKTYSIADITNCYGTPNTISTRTDGRIFGYNNANCTVTQTDNKTIDEEMIFGLGAQLLTTLDFVQGADETIWAARRGQIPAPAGLVANSDKLNVHFGKADQEIADGATGDSAEDPYIIENVEELYGFAVLSRTDNFAGKFIKLSDDIEDGVLNLNPGESAEDWAEGTVASLPWYSIGVGADNKRFAGHFDGNGKTISGIYINDDSSYLGLFAATETGSTITNLRLTNSYINYTGDGTAYTGSVVGDLRGDMTEVYSDAIVNSNGTQTGGLIGQVNALLKDDDTYAVDITNCWYAGQLTSSKTYAGGLLASTANGTVNVDNCLNTGTITTTATAGNEHNAVAGICAQVTGASTVTITDTISAGKITDANHGKNVKSVVGYIPNGTVNFENVFATKFAYGRALPSEGASGAHTGTVIRTHKANRLIGYCVGEIKTGETAPKLDFVTDWTIRTTDVPVPTCFADLVTPVTFAEGSTLDATLNTQIGLDTLGLSIVNAIDMGEGNYVLETTADDTLYSNYVAKLENDLGFGNPVAENSAGAGADGVHSVSYKKQNPDWVLTLTYVETTDVLTISINTDIDSLSDNLVYTEGVEDEDYMATGDITFSMLQMKEYTVDAEGKEIPVDAIYADLYLPKYFLNENSYWYGNSFVFQLPNGHFIVNDGGAREEFADLVTYLKTAAGTTEDGKNPVYIDAWIVSHQHGDHFDVIRAASDALRDETSNLMDDIYVDAFYINEPNAKILAKASLDDDVDSQYNGMTLFTKGPDGEQADIYRMQTGQRYYFNGLVMDVIQAQEQIPYSKYGKFNASSSEPDFNTVSTVTLFTTSNNQKILIGGDANYANMQYIMDAYGIENDYTKSALLKNINVFVAFHHGKNMSMNINGTVGYGFIDYLTKDGSESGHLFDYVLYPCSLVYNDDSDPAYAFPNAGEANEYLNKKVKNNNYKHYGDGNVVITLQ